MTPSTATVSTSRTSRATIDESFEASLSDGGRVLTVAGILDELSIHDFRHVVQRAQQNLDAPLVIDLTRVDFLPSLALGVLVGAKRRGPVRLVAEDKSLAARVLQMTALPYETTLSPA